MDGGCTSEPLILSKVIAQTDRRDDGKRLDFQKSLLGLSDSVKRNCEFCDN
ncbi:hypothetical protein J6590_089227 [Homalodisca vitripennis]|nr:hypothetical protein J6590_089227 [Homalodisca vitripennis]